MKEISKFQSAVAHELISNARKGSCLKGRLFCFKALSRMSSFPTRKVADSVHRRCIVSKRCRA